MDNLNDLKAIWRSADTTGLPNADEIKAIIKKYRNQKLVKTAALVFAAICLTAMMIAIMFIYKSTMVTTRIGEGCMIVAGLILVITNLSTVNRFYKHKDLNNKEFIAFLEHTRVRRLFYYTKTQVAGFTLCSGGLLLYLYEMVYNHIVIAIIAYALTVTWILIMWLVVRPRTFKKQAKKLNETIQRMESLSKQL